jgi:hypothetical protein
MANRFTQVLGIYYIFHSLQTRIIVQSEISERLRYGNLA